MLGQADPALPCTALVSQMNRAIQESAKLAQREAEGNPWEPPGFCTIQDGAERLMDAAGVSPDIQKKPETVALARRTIAYGLADHPGQPIRITWGQVYDLREQLAERECAKSADPEACAVAGIDLIGYSLFSAGGKLFTENAVAVGGPPGWVLAGGIDAAEESFQCKPDAVRMAVEAGATVALVVPWCRSPGIATACVATREGSAGLLEDAGAAVKALIGGETETTAARGTDEGVLVTMQGRRPQAAAAEPPPVAAATPLPGKLDAKDLGRAFDNLTVARDPVATLLNNGVPESQAALLKRQVIDQLVEDGHESNEVARAVDDLIRRPADARQLSMSLDIDREATVASFRDDVGRISERQKPGSAWLAISHRLGDDAYDIYRELVGRGVRPRWASEFAWRAVDAQGANNPFEAGRRAEEIAPLLFGREHMWEDLRLVTDQEGLDAMVWRALAYAH